MSSGKYRRGSVSNSQKNLDSCKARGHWNLMCKSELVEVGQESDSIAQIIEAAIECISARSFEKATMKENARAAELLKNLVHYHFKHKEDRLLAVVENVAAETARTIQKRLLKSKHSWACSKP